MNLAHLQATKQSTFPLFWLADLQNIIVGYDRGFRGVRYFEDLPGPELSRRRRIPREVQDPSPSSRTIERGVSHTTPYKRITTYYFRFFGMI